MYMQSRMIVSGAAVLAVGWMPELPPLWLLLLAALLSALLALCFRHIGVLLLCSVLGLLYGTLWGQQLLDARLPAALEGSRLRAELQVLEPPQRRLRSQGEPLQRFAALVRLLDCDSAPGCEPSYRVLLSYYGELPLRAGERWRGEVKLKRPYGLSNPGSFNRESWLAQHGFAATGYLRDSPLQRVSQGQGSPLQRWRQHLADRLAAKVDHPTVHGVLLALSNGDRSGLSQSDWARFQRYGLNHLLVISGLHVGLVAGLGFVIGGVFGRRSAHGVALLAATVYAGLAGFSLPTVRALAMLLSVQTVSLLARKSPATLGLSLSLLVVALLDPLASHSAGFWLSFVAVAVIFYLRHMFPDLNNWRMAVLVQCVLAPAMGILAAYWYGGLGWLSPLVNLMAVPILGIWLAPLSLTAALLPPLEELCWSLASLPVHGFLWLDNHIAPSLSPWMPYRPSLPAAISALLGLLWFANHRAIGHRLLAVPLFAIALMPASLPLPVGRTEITLLDVGQGLSLILRRRDFTLVYDTGDGDPQGFNMASAVIQPYLERQGVEHIDLLVISHGDRDHASGVSVLRERFSLGEIWIG
ncbi:MAG: ComEC/Rec2 family competence protein, partial [Pseudomonadota bacterium]